MPALVGLILALLAIYAVLWLIVNGLLYSGAYFTFVVDEGLRQLVGGRPLIAWGILGGIVGACIAVSISARRERVPAAGNVSIGAAIVVGILLLSTGGPPLLSKPSWIARLRSPMKVGGAGVCAEVRDATCGPPALTTADPVCVFALAEDADLANLFHLTYTYRIVTAQGTPVASETIPYRLARQPNTNRNLAGWRCFAPLAAGNYAAAVSVLNHQTREQGDAVVTFTVSRDPDERVWQGSYTQGSSRTAFSASIVIRAGRIRGRTTETIRAGSATNVRYASIDGTISGSTVQFMKTYEGERNGPQYRGIRVGNQITGTWHAGNNRGDFEMAARR